MQNTAEFSAVAAHGVTGRLFWAVYTGTRPGWRRRELAPRCSATRIRCITRTRLDRHAVTLSYLYHTHHPHHPHHTRIKPGVAFLLVVARMFAPSVGTMMNGEHAFATGMEIATALHHTSGLRTSSTAAATQSVNFASVPAAVVGSLPPGEVFAAPVYDQVHQEQIAASEMTENIAEILVVQQQVIVGTLPERLVDARGPQGGLACGMPAL